MPHHVHVFTYKAGLLSRVAHDLRLAPERFTITREDDEFVATFEAASLRVDGVMHGDRLDRSELSSRDRAKIAATLANELLVTRAHREIVFRGRVRATTSPLVLEGRLTLKGVTRPLAITARRVADRLHASIELTPSHFGIAPYKALAGAIRLQDRVRIALDLDPDLLALTEAAV